MGLVNITAQFKDDSSALPRGAILRHASLPLLDAMNALPVLDPAMDLAIDAVEHELFDPSQPYSAADLCWIMDEMLRLEVAWHMGGSLSFSVYECLHYHNPQHMVASQDPLVSLILRSSVLAFAKCVDLAQRELAKGQVYDGEDVWLDHFGVPITLSDETQDILELVEEALVWLESRTEVDLLERLEFRKCILQTLDMQPPSPLGGTPVIPTNWSSTPSSPPSPFDKRIAMYLRWHGPCPISATPSTSEAYSKMRDMMQDVLKIRSQASATGIAPLNMGLCEGSGRVPLTLSVAKTILDGADLIEGGWPADTSVSQLMHLVPRNQDKRTRTLHALIESVGRAKEELNQCLLAMIAIPLSNVCRQRRKFLSMSYSWLERAVASRYLGNPSLEMSLLALRLDCLLEAALCALRLNLIPFTEQALTWWWIREVTSARRRMRTADECAKLWADVWYCISSAMLSLVARDPTSIRHVTVSHFNLRFKWERKVVPSHDTLRPLYPRYSNWILFSRRIGSRDTVHTLSLASDCFRRALNLLDDFEGAKRKMQVAGLRQQSTLELRREIEWNLHRESTGWRQQPGIWLSLLE